METRAQPQENAALVQMAVGRHQAALLGYVRQLAGGDAARARQVVDEVLAELRKQPAEVEDELMEWLFATARKRVSGRAGGGSRLEDGARGGGSVEGGADGEPAHQTMQRVIESLTPKQLEAVRLKFQHGFTYREIARITELSPFSVGQLVHNAVSHVGREFAKARAEDAPPSLDDPRLTAYALGELEARERKGFESAQIDAKGAGERITAVRGLGNQITQALAIASGAPAPSGSRRRRRRRAPAWLRSGRTWLAVGGAALLAGVAVVVVRSRTDKAPPAVRHDEDFRLKPAKWNDPSPAVAGDEGKVAGGGAGSGAAAAKDSGQIRLGLNFGSKAGSDGGGGDSASSAAVAERPAGAPSRDAPDSEGGQPATTTMSAEPPAREAGIETGAPDSGLTATPQAPTGEVPVTGARAKPEGHAGAVALASAATLPSAGEAASPVRSGAVRTAPNPSATQSTAKNASGAVTRGPAEPGPPMQRADRQPRSEVPAAPDATPMIALKRTLGAGAWPAAGQVRLEAMLNYFPPAAVPTPKSGLFGVSLEATEAPWEPAHRLVRVALQGRPESAPARPPACVVFLVDVSGSMEAANRLPLVQEALRRLLPRLRPDDRVGLVTYAGDSRLSLAPTPVAQAAVIRAALDRLKAGGQTNGGAGLELAFELVRAQATPVGLNAIILCTDGGFNVGATSEEDLTRIVDRFAGTPITLGVFGFGRGTRIDGRLEALAIRGRGRSGYVNTRLDAERVVTEQVNGLLAPLAKEVRVEVEFNPGQVRGYRLLGYDGEGPMPGADATRGNAGETVLPGHTLTALYEIEPAPAKPAARPGPAEPLLTVRVGYRFPEGGAVRLEAFPLVDRGTRFADAGPDFRFATTVAAFGRALRAGPARGAEALDQVEAWGRECLADDAGGYRAEFLRLVAEARQAAGAAQAAAAPVQGR